MKKCIILCVAAMVLFALSVDVEAGPPETGFFLGVGGSYASENFDVDDIEDFTGFNVDVDDAWGINAYAGYRINRHFALEGNFNWYDDFDAEAGPIDFEVKIWTLMLDLRAMYPFYEDRLVPYLRVGGGYMDAEVEVGSFDDSDGDFAWNLGAGLDFYVTDQISIGPNFKYVWGTGDLDELEYFVSTFSVSFHF